MSDQELKDMLSKLGQALTIKMANQLNDCRIVMNDFIGQAVNEIYNGLSKVTTEVPAVTPEQANN